MVKFVFVAALGAGVALGAVPAFAGGDCGALTRQINSICEMQKRGQGPLTPNMCLPELPPNAAAPSPQARGL